MRQLYAFLILVMLSTTAIAANPQVLVETNQGNFIVELYPDKAPKTVANFLDYVNSGFYRHGYSAGNCRHANGLCRRLW